MQRSRILLLVYIIILQVLDILTTYLALSRGAVEINPIVSFMLQNPFLFWAIKVIVAITVYVAVASTDNKSTNNKLLIIIYSLIMIQAIAINIFNFFR